MKKYVSVLMAIVLLLGVVAFTLPGGVDNSYYGDDEPLPGEEPTELWYKTRESCPNDPTKTEYSCDSGGTEQCQVQNCP